MVRFNTLVSIAFVTLMAACGGGEVGDDVLDVVRTGMSRDSVLAAIGTGPLSATGHDTVRLVNGFRHMRYFRDGKNIEVIYFRTEPGTVTEPVEQKRETPVVLENDRAMGWGWAFFVEAMKTYGLPTPLFEKPAPKVDSAKADSTKSDSVRADSAAPPTTP